VNKRIISVFLASAFSMSAGAQQSQTLRDRDPELAAAKKIADDLQQANYHRGAFYLMSRIRLADAGYTEAGVIPTAETAGGFSLSVEAPNRLYFVPRKKTVYSVEVVPGYTWFSEGERQGQFNYRARADAHFLLNHLYLNLYTQRADQLRAHVADINRLATARENETGVAGEIKYSSRTSALFILRRRDLSYPGNRIQPVNASSDPIPVEVLDRSENNVRVSMHHKTFPRTSLFVAGEASDHDFRNKESYSSRRTYAGGGFLYDTGRTRLRVEAGPAKLDFQDPAERDYSGITAEVGASRDAGRRRFYAIGARDLGFSIFLGNPYYVSTTAALGLDYRRNPRWTLHARTTAERDEYETPVEGRYRTDEISFTSLGFTYNPRRFAVGLDVGWYERDSTAFGDTDSGIRYVIRLSLTP
jgi:hypothetical protein